MISDGKLGFNPLDSRFRGNDGVKAGNDGVEIGNGGGEIRNGRVEVVNGDEAIPLSVPNAGAR